MANFDFKETFLNPIFKGNPISVLVLGICSSLAVTVQLKGAFVMGLSVIIHQAPPSLEFSRQEHWSWLPFPSPMHQSEK